MSVAELLNASLVVCEAVPQLTGAHWADVFGQKRIVSEWHVPNPSPLVGYAPLNFGLATLGGVVGDVQQWLPHEAKLHHDQPHVLFLMPGPLGRLWVTGMFQGAYRVQDRASNATLALSDEQAELANEPSSACARLAGLTSGEVAQLLSAVRS